MKVGGFFVLLVRHPKHQPEERKTKSENTYRTRVVCGINRRSLGTDPREWILPDGRHLRAAALAQLTKLHDLRQLVYSWQR